MHLLHLIQLTNLIFSSFSMMSSSNMCCCMLHIRLELFEIILGDNVGCNINYCIKYTFGGIQNKRSHN